MKKVGLYFWRVTEPGRRPYTSRFRVSEADAPRYFPGAVLERVEWDKIVIDVPETPEEEQEKRRLLALWRTPSGPPSPQ